MRHFWQLCYGGFLVNVLLSIQITKFRSIKAHPKIRPQHTLSFLKITRQAESVKFLFRAVASVSLIL